MIESTKINLWNQHTVALVQASLGVISTNFRMVSLALDNDVRKLQFVLETEAVDDLYEIENIATEFEVQTDFRVRYSVEVEIASEAFSSHSRDLSPKGDLRATPIDWATAPDSLR